MKQATRNRQRTRKHRDEYRAKRRIDSAFWGGVGIKRFMRTLSQYRFARMIRHPHGLEAVFQKQGTP